MRLDDVVLLLEFGDDALLDCGEVLVLEAGELDQLGRPNRLHITMLPRSRYDRASNQILVGIDNLVILEAQEREEINVLLHECD